MTKKTPTTIKKTVAKKPETKKTGEINMLTATIPSNLNGQRIDIALVEIFPELNRTKVRKLIDSGMVFLNRKRIWIAKYAVSAKETLEVNTNNGDNQLMEFGPKNILFENENFIIVNKPAGMVVEDAKHNFPIFAELKKLGRYANDPTLRNKPVDHQAPEEEFFIVHRLDRDTSGLLIIAKNQFYQQELIALWGNKKIQKFYQCICFNVPKKLQGTINTNIGQNTGKSKYPIAESKNKEGGKTAVTDFKVNAVLQKGMASIINVQPKTGRSHQIRIHLASIDCPILGDKIYSIKLKANHLYSVANRQMLHASQLIFELNDIKYNFHAPVPSDFNQTVKHIKNLKPINLNPTLKPITVSKRKKPMKRRTIAEKINRKAIFGGKKK